MEGIGSAITGKRTGESFEFFDLRKWTGSIPRSNPGEVRPRGKRNAVVMTTGCGSQQLNFLMVRLTIATSVWRSNGDRQRHGRQGSGKKLKQYECSDGAMEKVFHCVTTSGKHTLAGGLLQAKH